MAAFPSHAIKPGPLATHNIFRGKESQNKLKTLLLEAASHYVDQAATNKTTNEVLFSLDDDTNDMELLLTCEYLSARIHNERQAALCVQIEQSLAATEAKERHKRAVEAAEEFVGAVSSHQ